MKNHFPDISEEIFREIMQKLESFNVGKRADEGEYCILFPTEKSLYYTLWFHNPSAGYYPYIFISNLELNALSSVNRAMRITFNSYRTLNITDTIGTKFLNGDDIFTFGKYRGRHLQDVYAIDPHYITWVADKFEPHVRSEFRFHELALTYNKVYIDLQSGKKLRGARGSYVGKPGDKLTNLRLVISKVRIEDDSYKTRIYNGIEYFYVDQLLTAKDADDNMFLLTIKATDRSLSSRILSPNSHAFHVGEMIAISSAKVLKHIESHQFRYTKLGYVKLIVP